MRLAVVLCAGLAASAGLADTSTEAFLESCRALHEGREGGATCEAMLEGALGAFGLLGKDYSPISSALGYCLDPFMTPAEAAAVIVRYAETDPDCARLAHFSMCMNLAFQETRAGSC
ncbi:hypothetical protein [Maliponia aquimaris]|uniref:Rap1a immunity protein domain-containing protein n=1 Tax=Maliponia aquimaris TaxID=1673631 RepID=A0A238L0N7_9RHOB|nr:hypothetical protein [Maliponia aquimaris]SMX48488.1 hypothetical protein MAA8898_03958 [Maliponia aquimaris]